MADKNESNIKEALQQYMQRYGLQRKVEETKLIQHWPTIAGEFIARYTEEIRVQDGKMIIRVNSSVIKHQLLISRETIIQNVNQFMEREYISDITLL
jgi:predicted nucleic acid-binding Zn ribbon protein